MEHHFPGSHQNADRPTPFDADARDTGEQKIKLTVIARHVFIEFLMGIFSKMNIYTRIPGQAAFIFLGDCEKSPFMDPRIVPADADEVREYLLLGCKDGIETHQNGNIMRIILPPAIKKFYSNKPVVMANHTSCQVSLDWIMPSGFQMNIYSRKDTETDFALLGYGKHNCFKDRRPLEKPDLPETRYYQLVVVANGIEMCNYGEIISVVLEPVHPGLAAFMLLATLHLTPKYVRIDFQQTSLKVLGKNIYRRSQGETDFSFLTFTRSVVFRDPRPHDVSGEAIIWEYQFAGVVDGVEIGQRTSIQSIVIKPPVAIFNSFKPEGWLQIIGAHVRVNIVFYPGLGMNVYSRRECETDFSLLGYAKRSCFIDRRWNKFRLLAETCHYQLVLVVDGKEVGLRSDVLSITLDPIIPDNI